MAIGGGTLVASVSDATDATSYVTNAGAWTPVSGRLYVAFVTSTGANATASTTMTGNSLTWTLITSQLTGNSNAGITCYAASGAGGSSGETTANFGATQTGGIIHIVEFTGVDVSTVASSPGSGKTIVQAPTAVDTGTQASLSVTFASAGATGNRPVFSHTHVSTNAATERANWTEIAETSGSSPNRDMETQWRSDAFETTGSVTWTGNVRCCGIGLELKAALTEDAVGMIPIF